MARKRGIDLDQVLDAAAEVADRDGLAAVTPSAVAAALGVKPPSLYAHVDGAAGLRRGVARRANVRLTAALAAAADGADSPLAALRAICEAYRRFAIDHPGLYAALLPVPRPDDDPDGAALAAETVGVIIAPLAELGIDGARHVDTVRALRAMLHGFVDLELHGGFGLADPVDRSFAAAVDLALAAASAQ